MPRDFLHNHPQFADLIRIVADERKIVPALIENDYWIMQSLYGLQQLGMTFQLKGGTSLSKPVHRPWREAPQRGRRRPKGNRDASGRCSS